MTARDLMKIRIQSTTADMYKTFHHVYTTSRVLKRARLRRRARRIAFQFAIRRNIDEIYTLNLVSR